MGEARAHEYEGSNGVRDAWACGRTFRRWHGPQPPDANTTLQARGCITITGGRQHEDWPSIYEGSRHKKVPVRKAHTHADGKSSLSTARSVNARWCRAQHTAPTASELPSISCPTQWARCHHLRSQHFVRGSPQNEQGCDTHPQWLRGERGEKSFSSIVFHMIVQSCGS